MTKMELERLWHNRFSEAAKKAGEDYQISLWTKEGLESYIRYFMEYFRPYIKNDNSETRVLDLGCGPGTYSRFFAEKGFRILGVDYSDEMIEVAQKKTLGQAIDFRVADIYNLPFENSCFDMVVCFGVFQCLQKPDEAIKEIKRVLKEGALFILTTLNIFSLSNLLKKANASTIINKKYNPFQIKKALKNEDFRAIKLRGIYFFPRQLNFLTDWILKFKVYGLFNLLFPFFTILSHSFYLEAKKARSAV